MFFFILGGNNMKELQSKYNHHEVEKEKYAQWVKKGYYTAGDRLKKAILCGFATSQCDRNASFRTCL